jgi:prepilin-type N-terminal cleavage/methylation domain-containing protein
MKKSKGFTLVELSIALVVVGLVIGGILVAQSLISSAKVNAQVSQFQQIDAMVANFKTRYKYLPGDAPMFFKAGEHPNGYSNGNGWINDHALNAYGHFWCEGARFWYSLDPSKYSSTLCCCSLGAAPTTSGPNKNVEASKIGKKGSFIIATMPEAYPPAANENWYFILDPTQAQVVGTYGYQYSATSSANSAVTPADAQALDAKMDNGIGNTGNVRAGRIQSYIAPNVGNSLSTCSNGSGVYQVQNSGFECTPVIRMGAQTGQVQ